jgi:hypothetical protein
MSEELQKKFIEWIETIMKGTAQEIPEILRETIQFAIIYNIFISILMIIFICIFVMIGRYYYKKIPPPKESYDIPLFGRQLTLRGS